MNATANIAPAPTVDEINDMLCNRNQELEHEKQTLLEEIDQLQTENAELRRQLSMARGV